MDWLIHNNIPKVGNIFIGILVFPLMLVYVLAVVYLMFRKDTVATFEDQTAAGLENGINNSEENPQVIPYRQDLADIPLPE